MEMNVLEHIDDDTNQSHDTHSPENRTGLNRGNQFVIFDHGVMPLFIIQNLYASSLSTLGITSWSLRTKQLTPYDVITYE
jgi:hypothetical protein